MRLQFRHGSLHPIDRSLPLVGGQKAEGLRMKREDQGFRGCEAE
jgi:hypothetical protein